MLTIPQTTEDVAAAQVAQQLITQAIQSAQRTASILDGGVPAQPGQESRTMPNGQVIPGNPGTPGVSAEKITMVVGSSNMLKLDVARLALLGDVSVEQLNEAKAALVG